jgi:hypothetical protein
MDPNVVLAKLREAVKELENDPSDTFAADYVVGEFTALDEWFKKGGFLPRDWEKAGRWNG